MIKQSKKAFSFVELIITISIIVLLATIWFSSNKNYNEKVDNAKSVSDIHIITNSLEQYLQERKTLPLPKWNKSSYKEDWSYTHSYDSPDTFWVYGSITEKTLPKRYLNIPILDSRTNQYYSYWKLKQYNEYEVAGVNWKNWEPSAYVKWNYKHYWTETAELWFLENIIREYNWPNFVYTKSKSNFPYNPDEKVLVWRINNYDWTVSINDSITEIDDILNHVLVEWDKINVSAGGFAEIYFSDWSTSSLWDTNWNSELILEEMNFKEDNSLFTKIKLALSSGTIWNKATDLDDDSEFEIYTTDATAAVRWTIFGVKKDSSSNYTNITVKEWEVTITPTPKLNTNSNAIQTDINVIRGENEKWIDMFWSNNDTTNQISTWALDSAHKKVKENVILNHWTVNPTIYVDTLHFKTDPTNNKVNFKIKSVEAFKYADFFYVYYRDWEKKWKEIFIKNYWKDLDDEILYSNWTSDKVIILSDIDTYDSEYIDIAFGIYTINWIVFSKKQQENLHIAKYNMRNGKDVSINDIIEKSTCDFWVWPKDHKHYPRECADKVVDQKLIEQWYSLLAYAPYNVSWDLNLYNKKGWEYSYYQQDIIWNDHSVVWGECDNNSRNSSFCNISNEYKWIYIDNENERDSGNIHYWEKDYHDYLKYSWVNLGRSNTIDWTSTDHESDSESESELANNSTYDFIIDMSVNIHALKNTTDPIFLFDTEVWKTWLYLLKFDTEVWKTWLYLLKMDSNYMIKINNKVLGAFDLDLPNDQKFINIRLINWKELKIWEKIINLNKNEHTISIKDLYVWSKNDSDLGYIFQLNWVVDYIKIYTKDQ